MAETTTDFSLFVGDLAPDVNDVYLEMFFRQYFPSVRSAKVIADTASGRSKGYGFIRFGAEAERDRALTEMNGQVLSSRPVRVSVATAKRKSTATGSPGPASTVQDRLPGPGASEQDWGPVAALAGSAPAGPAPAPPGAAAAPGTGAGTELDPTNTTLFIGGLSGAVTEDQLRALFGRYGDIVYTKVPQGKGCGFVQFMDRRAAEYAMQALNGVLVAGSAMRVSWGRSHGKPPPSQQQHQQQHATYGGGYASVGPYGAPHGAFDPSAYGGAYGMYPAGADAYAAYGATAYPGAMDPYGGYSYMVPVGAQYMGGGAMVPMAHGGGQVAGGPGGGGGATFVPISVLYDPSQQANVERMNAAYVQRQMPGLTGQFMRFNM